MADSEQATFDNSEVTNEPQTQAVAAQEEQPVVGTIPDAGSGEQPNTPLKATIKEKPVQNVRQEQNIQSMMEVVPKTPRSISQALVEVISNKIPADHKDADIWYPVLKLVRECCGEHDRRFLERNNQ